MSHVSPSANYHEEIPPHSVAMYCVAIDSALTSAAASFLQYGIVIENEGSASEAARLLHDALNHSAAVSRFFWPPANAKKPAANRANVLRDKYRVDSTSPLADRDLRNELEHFDEKMDTWVMQGTVGPVIASPIFADHSIGDDGFGCAFKVVDVDNDVFVVLGRKYEFGKISAEVVRLLCGDRAAANGPKP